jgi:hypothetical protein
MRCTHKALFSGCSKQLPCGCSRQRLELNSIACNTRKRRVLLAKRNLQVLRSSRTVLSCYCSVAVGVLLGVLLVLLIKPPAGFNKHVIVMTGLGERVAQHLL